MNSDERLREIERQWHDDLLDDERMREIAQRLDQQARSSHALVRARQGRPEGRRLRRSDNPVTGAAGRA